MTQKRKIIYIHVAKTAGTSLNSFIASHFPSDQVLVHIEINPDWADPAKLPYFESKSFLSGHITADNFRRKIPGDDFYRLATFRRPIDHVISHIAHVRSLCEPSQVGGFRSAIPAIQELARKLEKMDLSDPRVVGDFVAKFERQERVLFDNVQTRYLLAMPWPESVMPEHFPEARERLYGLDMVGLAERYKDTVEMLCRYHGWTMPGSLRKENAGTSAYGMDAGSEELYEALLPAIRVDELLYREASQIFEQRMKSILVEAAVPEQRVKS